MIAKIANLLVFPHTYVAVPSCHASVAFDTRIDVSCVASIPVLAEQLMDGRCLPREKNTTVSQPEVYGDEPVKPDLAHASNPALRTFESPQPT